MVVIFVEQRLSIGCARCRRVIRHGEHMACIQGSTVRPYAKHHQRNLGLRMLV
tara:strand:- start:224 stop:382 length:159 start_codon:yes stop_codon:yes gene_type:complete